MFKKFLLFCAIVLGLIYGSGSSPTKIKERITNASDESARDFSGGEDGGWGEGS